MRHLRPSLLAALGGIAFGACASEDPGPTTDIAAACNPLGGTTCLMPWPSSAYLVEADTPSGYRVDLPRDAMPVNINDSVVDPEPFNRYDGFAPSGVILAGFPGGVSGEGLPPHTDPDLSLADDAPILLFDVETGERIAFFAEVDLNTDDGTQRSLIIHPLQRLHPATRYGVAVRSAVRAADGSALPVPPAFAALRDGTPFVHPLMDRLRASWPALSAALDDAGVPLDDVVVAWDFVTASDEFLTGDLLAMREQATPLIGDAGANLSFTAEEAEGNPTLVHKLLLGTFDSPDFLTDGEAIDSILRRDGAGVPQPDGFRAANFAAIIPQCATTAPLPLPVVIFGHGLFGSAEDYLDDDFLQEVAQDNCYVVVAGDFIGLTKRQIATAALVANDMSQAAGITEKLAQSVIDFIALENLVRGPLKDDALFAIDGEPVIDPELVYYLGGSLGGIMGNVFMAYDQHILQGGLGVPGGAWSLLFERSYAWTALQGASLGAYEDQYLYQILIAMLGMRFEPYDPITTAGRVIDDPLPDTPAKQILMYEAIGDCLVTNLSTELVAREMGLDVNGPTLRTPYALAVQMAPTTSGLTIYDEHREPLPPTTNVPPGEDNGTHSGVNKRDAVLRQVTRFFDEGLVSNQCLDGATVVACDCASGACD